MARLEGPKRAKKLTATRPEDVRAIVDPPFDPAFWRERTERDVRALLEQLASAAFVRLEDTFGVSFDLEAEFAQLFVSNRANQLAGEVTSTTYNQITTQLMEGIGEGESIPDLAARVRRVFDATASRAETIARTEVLGGFNAAAQAAANTLPGDVVAAKQWVATRDSRTRASHNYADGQIVAVDQPFLVGGAAAMYPGDPDLPAGECVNCRCALVFLDEDTYAAEVAVMAEAQALEPVTVGRARVALALVVPGQDLDLQRFRKALVA